MGTPSNICLFLMSEEKMVENQFLWGKSSIWSQQWPTLPCSLIHLASTHLPKWINQRQYDPHVFPNLTQFIKYDWNSPSSPCCWLAAENASNRPDGIIWFSDWFSSVMYYIRDLPSCEVNVKELFASLFLAFRGYHPINHNSGNRFYKRQLQWYLKGIDSIFHHLQHELLGFLAKCNRPLQ